MEEALSQFLHFNTFVYYMNSAKLQTVMVEDGRIDGWMDDESIDGQLVDNG